MRTRTWCVAAALVCLSSLAAAQAVLSESDAIARLYAESPRVRAIRTGVEVARAEALAAGRWPNPLFTFNREAVAGVTENMVFVTQRLPVSGRRGLEVNAASSLAVGSERRADAAVRQVRAALRQAYADLVAAQRREAAIAAMQEQVTGLAVILGRREAAGEAAGYDRLRAEREVMELHADRSAARAARIRAQAELAGFFAPSTDAAGLVAAIPDLPLESPLPGVDELVAHAAGTLPEIAAVRQEIESARFAARAAQRRVIPEPEVVAGTKSSTLGGGDVGTVLSVHATVSLFDRARPERELAGARRAEAEAQIASLEASLRTQIAGLLTIIVERRQAAAVYRGSAVASANQLERIAQVSYDAGERGILELLDAYRTAGASRTRQIDLDASARRAELELELVSGWEIQ
jgi:cobalt-zinc-cadmium efflux system outer membrane protein